MSTRICRERCGFWDASRCGVSLKLSAIPLSQNANLDDRGGNRMNRILDAKIVWLCFQHSISYRACNRRGGRVPRLDQTQLSRTRRRQRRRAAQLGATRAHLRQRRHVSTLQQPQVSAQLVAWPAKVAFTEVFFFGQFVCLQDVNPPVP